MCKSSSLIESISTIYLARPFPISEVSRTIHTNEVEVARSSQSAGKAVLGYEVTIKGRKIKNSYGIWQVSVLNRRKSIQAEWLTKVRSVSSPGPDRQRKPSIKCLVSTRCLQRSQIKMNITYKRRGTVPLNWNGAIILFIYYIQSNRSDLWYKHLYQFILCHIFRCKNRANVQVWPDIMREGGFEGMFLCGIRHPANW